MASCVPGFDASLVPVLLNCEDALTACSDYIQLCDGGKDTLAASLDRIQQAVSTIITAILDDAEVCEAR